MNIARNGICRRIIPWSLRTMRRRVPNWPRKWAWVKTAGIAAGQSREGFAGVLAKMGAPTHHLVKVIRGAPLRRRASGGAPDTAGSGHSSPAHHSRTARAVRLLAGEVDPDQIGRANV